MPIVAMAPVKQKMPGALPAVRAVYGNNIIIIYKYS